MRNAFEKVGGKGHPIILCLPVFLTDIGSPSNLVMCIGILRFTALPNSGVFHYNNINYGNSQGTFCIDLPFFLLLYIK